MNKIALDALGADAGPSVLVEGALAALPRIQSAIVLCGDEAVLKSLLDGKRYDASRLEIVHAPEVVDMHTKPRESLKKKESSIAAAVNLVKNGDAEGLISAGSTGATTAFALMGLKRLKGIKKPAIATVFPTEKKPILFLDMGATVDCKPEVLLQFAQMGSCYCCDVLGRENPRVGLLNIGEEPTKGNEVVLRAHQLIRESSVNFGGNAEGNDIFSGEFDVMVCDGFVGNIVLKFGESVGRFMMSMMKEELSKSWINLLGGKLAKPGIKRMLKRVDRAERGGAPLLGVNGNVFICHGSSCARTIESAIVGAEATIQHSPNAHIIELVKQEHEILEHAEQMEAEAGAKSNGAKTLVEAVTSPV